MAGETEYTSAPVAVDDPNNPLVVWFPETRQLELRTDDMLKALGYIAGESETLEALKKRIHDRVKQAFEGDEIDTLMQARLHCFDLILKAAKKGELVAIVEPSAAALLRDRVIN